VQAALQRIPASPHRSVTVTAHATIPPEVLRVQAEASDPHVSAWVAANAGSGKTHVLAQRVIRLLLDGCPPSRILCLTFTKAAAANMASRVFDTLARWTALSDDRLDAAIARVDGRAPDARRRAHARRLFAEALETPGGLKVQTIHAFCTRLLHQFPFEANVAARFTVLEERAETELINRLRLDVLQEAAAAPDSALGRALATAVASAADQTFAEVVREAIGKRGEIVRWMAQAPGLAGAVAQLARALGIEPGVTLEEIEAEMVHGPLMPSATWTDVAARLARGQAGDQKQASCLRNAAAAAGRQQVETYLQIFFTKDKGEPRKSIASRAIETGEPDLFRLLCAERDRLVGLREKRHAVVARERSAALLAIVSEVIARYGAEKERRGLLDYEDLIDKTLALFGKVSAAWVLYKLDLGIDHVLIDEAQDTSPKQWDVVKALVAEFFAGEGARIGIKRTIFAVGDEKQSIFSFQGAAPRQFAEMRREFELIHRDAALPFVARDFKYSFRSAPVVLEAVDGVFERPQAYGGLAADPVRTVHQAIRDTAPGLVEIWPMIEPEEKPDAEAWDAPFDATSETTPNVKLARRIAKAVAAWTTGGEIVSDLQTGEPRPVRPGDVLVLVRQRGALFEAVIRALKAAEIAVAGADRLMLTEHIAVMDLMALGDALLLEEDDLALATILKSPLFGFDEQQLFDLACNRQGSLRRALRAAAGALEIATAARLDRLAAAARTQAPFAFYARVLGAEGGRARMLARLGHEAADALDEFLSLALDYEKRETPSLQGFLAWLRASPTEIKRDMEIARDEVRVMTVHGAKGLEAPIVILADTTTRPAGPRDPRLMPLANGGSGPAPLVWAGVKATDFGAVTAARERARRAAEDEHRRLLYVAMTRAADRLIVAGARGHNKPPDGCWYALVHDALEPGAAEVPSEDIGVTVWRLRKSLAHRAHATPAISGEPRAGALPPWLRQQAVAEDGPAWLSPSTAFAEPAAGHRGDDRKARERALARGKLVHRLLQSLPDLAPERRESAAREYLRRSADELSETEQTQLAAQVLSVLRDSRFLPLTGPESRAEVPIVGRIERSGSEPILVSGQVDRLVVTPEAVFIADYKTDRSAPPEPSAVPEVYLGQLAAYRAVLASLYSERPVRAALVWMEGPDFMEIPAELLDAALARLKAA
jgi:ATP-dependent helicase/nuclease subunit A